MTGIARSLPLWLALAVAVAPAAAQETPARGDSAGVVAASPDAAPRGELVVTAVGVRSGQGGDLLFLLYRGEAGWLKPDRAFAKLAVPARDDSVQVRFVALPPDTAWAVQVIHDKNGNGRFDMRTFPFPKPKEGGGVSNNHTRMGPPKFARARFALADSLGALRVIMRY